MAQNAFFKSFYRCKGKYSPLFYLFLLVVMFPGIHSALAGYLQYDYFRPFDRVYSSGSSYDARYYQAAKELEPLLRKEQAIEYFGWHPILPYMLGKKLPSRFCVVYHLLMRRPDGQLSALQEQWIREYTDDVIKARPRFFLVADQVPGWDVFNLQSPSLKDALHERFPELEAFLKEHYFLYEKNSLLEIYVRSGR